MNSGFPDLLSLNLFRATVREGTVTAAALRFGIGQPHATRLLAQLQRRLRLVLLVRSGRRLVPTDAGLLFLEEVDRALAGLDHLADSARTIAADRRRPVRLLVQSHLAHGLMPKVLARLAIASPELRVDLDIRQRNRLTEWAGRSASDAILAMWPLDIPHAAGEALFEASYGLAIPSRHPLARHSQITRRQLAEHAFINVRPGLSTRDRLQALCAGQAGTPRIVAETGSVMSAVQLAAEGLGLALTDPFLPTLFKGDRRIVFRAIVGSPKVVYGLAVQDNRALWLPTLREAIVREGKAILATSFAA
jgi:DNA-binding transcriptional LysR family regulator